MKAARTSILCVKKENPRLCMSYYCLSSTRSMIFYFDLLFLSHTYYSIEEIVMAGKIYFEFSFVNPFWGIMKWLLENISVYLYARQL